jgi:hypothetical protein
MSATFRRYPLFLMLLNSNAPFSSACVKLSSVESFALSSTTVADGMVIPEVSQITPLMVVRAGDCAKRLLEHNKNKTSKNRTFLIF